MLILQHPAEAREPLSSLPLFRQYFPFVHVAIGLSWPTLEAAWSKAEADGDCPKNGVYVCYPQTKAKTIVQAAFASQNAAANEKHSIGSSSTAQQQAPSLKSAKLIVLLDGTWDQTKTLCWRNRWLARSPMLRLEPASPSIYGKVRPSPRKDCVSTLEAGLLVWELFGAEQHICSSIRSAFRKFVQIHRDAKKSQLEAEQQLGLKRATPWTRSGHHQLRSLQDPQPLTESFQPG